MLNFLKNVGIGIGGIIGGVFALVVLTILFGGIWLILSALGIVSYALVRVIGWFLIGVIGTIAFAYIIGSLIRASKK